MQMRATVNQPLQITNLMRQTQLMLGSLGFQLRCPGGLHASSWSRVILSDTSAQSDMSDWIVCQIKY
jgi:hypothetical protein